MGFLDSLQTGGKLFNTAGGEEIGHLWQIVQKKSRNERTFSASFSTVAFVLGDAHRVFQTLVAVLPRDNTVVAHTRSTCFHHELAHVRNNIAKEVFSTAATLNK